MSDIKKIAIVTNYNIQEKLTAAVSVADKLSQYVETVYIPSSFKDRIMRAHLHRKYFS